MATVETVNSDLTPEVEIKLTNTNTKKKWVKFEDETKSNGNNVDGKEDSGKSDTNNRTTTAEFHKRNEQTTSAVLPTESVHIKVKDIRLAEQQNLDSISVQNSPMRNVDLNETSNGVSSHNTIRQGFVNGDIIVTLLPVNTNFPWITPAKFRPELVPEELMAQGLTLTVEDYVHIMEMLTNDLRFTLYNVCYKRVLILWIFTAFLVLFGLILSGVQGLTLFSLGVLWLMMNSAAIFLCMWIKIKLNRNLERCIAQVNRHLMRHKIILGLDDRGKISCHKVNLCFIYFDTTDCVKKLQDIIEAEEAAGRTVSKSLSKNDEKTKRQFQERLDIDNQDIVIQGANAVRISRKQERGEQLFTRYIQRWSKDFLRRRLDWTVDEERGNPVDARHLSTALCPCQYIEEYLRCKPRIDKRAFCPVFSSYMREKGID
ncbi:uncharacterized protein LOC135838437 [Planococcus citri]|uniref:uncharacterized protein LOC135838437 n=1 Tax=Planococcus citri TaxID=170843 RepID=UPI0031F84078